MGYIIFWFKLFSYRYLIISAKDILFSLSCVCLCVCLCAPLTAYASAEMAPSRLACCGLSRVLASRLASGSCPAGRPIATWGTSQKHNVVCVHSVPLVWMGRM